MPRFDLRNCLIAALVIAVVCLCVEVRNARRDQQEAQAALAEIRAQIQVASPAIKATSDVVKRGADAVMDVMDAVGLPRK